MTKFTAKFKKRLEIKSVSFSYIVRVYEFHTCYLILLANIFDFAGKLYEIQSVMSWEELFLNHVQFLNN